MALIGLGLRTLSMQPANIGPIKLMIQSIDLREVSQFVDKLCGRTDGSLRTRAGGFRRRAPNRHRIRQRLRFSNCLTAPFALHRDAPGGAGYGRSMSKVTHLTVEEGGGQNRRRIHLREISGDSESPLETVGQDLRAARLRRGEELATASKR